MLKIITIASALLWAVPASATAIVDVDAQISGFLAVDGVPLDRGLGDAVSLHMAQAGPGEKADTLERADAVTVVNQTGDTQVIDLQLSYTDFCCRIYGAQVDDTTIEMASFDSLVSLFYALSDGERFDTYSAHACSTADTQPNNNSSIVYADFGAGRACGVNSPDTSQLGTTIFLAPGSSLTVGWAMRVSGFASDPAREADLPTGSTLLLLVSSLGTLGLVRRFC